MRMLYCIISIDFIQELFLSTSEGVFPSFLNCTTCTITHIRMMYLFVLFMYLLLLNVQAFQDECIYLK